MITTERRWTQEQAWAWYHQRKMPYGCNFVPSSAINWTEMWQAESFDEETITRELTWATQTGFNTCRVFLPYLVWQDNPTTMKERLDTFLSIAAHHALSIMPVLFDDCAFAGKDPYLGVQDAPIPGLHNSGWTPSPGPTIADNPATWPQLETYVKDVIGSFASDNRVLMWDLYNEPGNNARGTKSIPLLEQVFLWARDAASTQPLTAGAWWGYQETDALCLALSDIVTFHDYNDVPTLRARVAELQQTGYPLICTEWMARTRNSLIETHLPVFAEENIGCYMWGLVNGKTQTQYPWGSVKGAPEPALWFHDLFHKDGTPYNQQEIETLRRFGTLLRTPHHP